MTNRKRFDNLSNAELAKILVKGEWCDGCEGYALKICSTEECVELVRMWLERKCKDNPPADNKAEKLSKKLETVFMTNGDKIKSMDNAELAKVLCQSKEFSKCNYCSYCPSDIFCKESCIDGIEAWLESPTEENQPADKHVDLHKVADEVTRDNVNHPDHYNHGKIEVVDFIEDQHLGFHLGNAVKYISRAGRKDPARTVEDLRKAAWYLNRQIERLEMSLGGQNA